MVKNIIILVLALMSATSVAEPKLDNPIYLNSVKESRIKIALIDTGIILSAIPQEMLCADEHFDLTGQGIADYHGHGTTDALIIASQMDATQHCLMIIKFYNTSGQDINNFPNELKAIELAIKYKASYINMSLGGFERSERERSLLKQALDAGIKVVVAAGNDGLDFYRVGCNYYPACYDFRVPNFYVVASYEGNKRHHFSNYNGPVNAWENGYRRGTPPYVMTGTSQAAAAWTGRLVKNGGKPR